MHLTSPQPSQTQWLARPQPPAVTGGPRRDAAQSKQPQFGGNSFIPANAMQQFAVDTLGVWVPKAPVALSRSKLQFFEDTFLEFVEDAAFYFTIPIAGKLLGMAINKLYNPTGNYEDIGKSWTELAQKSKYVEEGVQQLTHSPMDKLKKPVLNKLIANKSGAVLGAVVSALTFEFMIQHAKNVITAKQFKTSNFTGVAGLEESRTELHEGEDDPVEKAKKRAWQAGGVVAGSLLSALALPKLVQKFGLHQAAGKALKYFNFASGSTGGFDTHKGFQLLLTFVGLAGYLDAARDRLEWKEQGTRLLVVIPYLLFGQQWASNGLAKLFEKLKLSGVDEETGKVIRKSIKDWGVNFTEGSAIEKAKNPETFLNMNITRDKAAVTKAIEEAKVTIPKQVASKIHNIHNYGVNWGSYILGAAVCGIGINLISYAITKERYKVQEQEKQRKKQQQLVRQPVLPHSNFNSAFSGTWQPQKTPFGYPQQYPQLPYAQPQRFPQGNRQAAGFSQWHG